MMSKLPNDMPIAWFWEERQHNGLMYVRDDDVWMVQVGFSVPQYVNQHLWVRNVQPLYIKVEG
jgi:hypothetical protein